MKKLVLALTVTLACVGAYAQGKIRFENNSLHLVYYTTDATSLLSADKASAGLGVMSGVTASGQTLTAELWGGSSASSLSKLATGSFSAGVEGTITGQNITPAGFPGGTAAFFQVLVYDSAAGSYAAASAAQNQYYGATAVFTTVPSGTLAANSIVTATSPSLSTWAVGTQNMDNSSYGAGARGAIAIQANVPEPTSLALLGLGAAGMMIFRRRK